MSLDTTAATPMTEESTPKVVLPESEGSSTTPQEANRTPGWYRSINTQYAIAYARLRRDNPALSLPTPYKGRNRFIQAVLCFPLNRLLPTRYMRMFWVKVLLGIIYAVTKSSKLTPYIPKLRARKRQRNAIRYMNRLIFLEPKVITTFHLGGGVGKTTQSIVQGLVTKHALPALPVSVIDCGEGTLIHRFKRNAHLSTLDILENHQAIVHPADLQRYCTIAEYGLKVIAWRQEGQLDDVRSISREQMRTVIATVTRHDGVLFCDLPGGASDSNRGALDATHQVQIVTVPAGDRLAQAVTSFSWLLENGYENLAQTAIIVINRCESHHDIAKVRAMFEKKHSQYLEHVRFVAFYKNREIAKGEQVHLTQLPRTHRAALYENVAAMLGNLADTRIGEDRARLTHKELPTAKCREDALRVPAVGKPSPQYKAVESED